MTTHDHDHTSDHTDTTTHTGDHTRYARAQGRRDGLVDAYRDFVGILERQTDADWVSDALIRNAREAQMGERSRWQGISWATPEVRAQGEAYESAWEEAYEYTLRMCYASLGNFMAWEEVA